MSVGLGIISTVLLFCVHYTLGRNYDMPGVIKEHQILVATGPYRWVRHPMYTTFFLSGLATFIISANWFVGLVFLIYCTTVTSMIGMEEQTLLGKFGDEYLAYMQHTGRFLPRFSKERTK